MRAFFIGLAYSSVVFGASTVGLVGTAIRQGFVAKLLDASSTATVAWAQALGGAGLVEPLSLVAQGSSLYLGGIFYGATVLTNAEPGRYTNGDAFAAKLTDTGPAAASAWALRAGGTGGDSASTVLLAGGSVYAVGRFGSPAISFGATTLRNMEQRPNFPSTDLYVTRIVETAAGADFTWAASAGGQRYNGALALARSGSRLCVAGFIGPAITFGSVVLATPGSVKADFLATIADQALPTLASQAVLPLPRMPLYPNPARGAVLVQVPTGLGIPATLTLLDVLGRVVRTAQAIAGLAYPLDLTGVAPGVYALRVQAEEATHKLLVE